MSEIFKHLGEGQQPSASEYNRLADAVTSLLQSTDVQYFSDSRGVHVRRMPSAKGVELQIFQITDVGDWGNYTCKKVGIDATHWDGSTGQTKLVDIGGDEEFEIFNLAENETTNVNALGIDDLLVARQASDDEGSLRWVGFSPKFAWWEV